MVWTEASWYLAAVIVLAAMVVALLALLRDRSRGRRRCPKCWYDMSGITGMTCPECGREQRKERAFFRTRRRWRGVVIAGGMVVLALGTGIAPALITGEWAKYTPIPVLRLGLSFFDKQAAEVGERVLGGTPVSLLTPFERLLLAQHHRRWLAEQLFLSTPRLSDPYETFGFGGRGTSWKPSYSAPMVMQNLVVLGADGRPVLPELMDALAQSEEHMQWMALTVHVNMGAPARANIPAIRAVLRREELGQRREYAIEVIMQMLVNDDRTLRALEQLAKDDSDDLLRLQAAAALVYVAPESERTVAALESIARNGEQRCSVAAVQMLGWVAHSTDSTSLPSLDRTLCFSHLKGGAGYKYGIEPNVAAPAAIAHGLEHSDPMVRRRAADVLGGLGARVTPFAPLLRARIDAEKDQRARWAAISAFVRAERQDFAFLVPELTALIGTVESEERQWAAWVLGQCGPVAAPALVPIAGAAMTSVTPWHGMYCEALAGIGGDGIDLLNGLLYADDPLAMAAAHALGRSTRDGVRARRFLLQAAEDADPQVRKRAADAMQHCMAHPEITDCMCALAEKDASAEVQLAALAWLYRDEDKPGIVKLCTRIAGDPNPAVAEAAMTVLAFCVADVEQARTELKRLSNEGSAEMRELARQKLANAELHISGSR